MTGILKVDQIQNNTGTAAMTINTAGQVNFPNGMTGENKYPFVALLGSNQSLSSSTNTIVQYNTTNAGAGLDPSSVFSTSNYRFIAPISGYYWLAANVRTANQGANARVDMIFLKNGAGVMAQGQNQQGSNDMGWSAMGIIQCAANDYIEVMVNANGGSSTTISNTSNTGNLGGSQTMSWFLGYLIQAT